MQVVYNKEKIELITKLEKGEEEFDLFNCEDINLDDTLTLDLKDDKE